MREEILEEARLLNVANVIREIEESYGDIDIQFMLDIPNKQVTVEVTITNDDGDDIQVSTNISFRVLMGSLNPDSFVESEIQDIIEDARVAADEDDD